MPGFVASSRARRNYKNLQSLNFTAATRAARDVAGAERIREKRIEAAERLRIVRLVEQELIPLLRDADEWTAVTFARLILSVPKVIHEGLVLELRDRLLGAVPDGRWRTLDHLERPAVYCYEALRGCGQGYGGGSGYPYPDPADE